MWRNLNLRMRILLGYGLILALAAILALFLLLRIDALNGRIKQLNDSVAMEAGAGASLAAQVAATQQHVERYLRQPQQQYFLAAQAALQNLDAEILHTHTMLASSSQQQRIDDLGRRLAAYRTTFQSLDTLIKEQKPIEARLDSHLSRSSVFMNSAIAANIRNGNTNADIAVSLVTAQSSLEAARRWVARLGSDQAENYGANAHAELDKAQHALNALPAALGNNFSTENVVTEIALSSTSADQLIQHLNQVQQQRDALINDQGQALKQQADAIAQAALNSLTMATGDLERQTNQMRQITIAALLLTMLLALVTGVQLARTIARPLQDLVAATTRINQGDYDVTVANRDGSELGRLATSFNQMAATLRQQGGEVRQQQTAMTQRNAELERALDAVQAAVAARETMATTVRTISVPVISILRQVIVVPLVGEIDEQRARTLLERLLAGVTEQRATIAILDITGVPFVDIELANWLLQAAGATRLLGAQCVLVGISPEVAQALVASGADFSLITTRADLRDAVEYALRATNKPLVVAP
jgi:rsbT co-antagonist protein RsbR